MNNIAVILASGEGGRYGSSVPKQFVKLNGKPIIHYVLDEYIKSSLFDKILIVINDLRYSYLFKNYKIKIIKGGATRTQSIYNAIQYAKRFNPINIIFQDSVRPMIKAEDLPVFIDYLKKFDAVSAAEIITDSMYPAVCREDFKLITSPEAFKFKALVECFKTENAQYTSIYPHLSAKYFTKRIFLNHPNYKITYPYDIFTLEQLIKYNQYEKNIPILENKTILVLGASGGIGQAVVKELAEYKCKVIAPSSKELNLSTDFSHTLPLADIIINASGIAHKNEEGILKHYNNMMNINFRANVIILEEVLKWNRHNKPVSIILVSSSSATRGRPGFTIYSASKTAVHSLVESRAAELAQHKIYLNCICPEKVNTPFWKKLNTSINKKEALTPDEVVKVILSYCDTTKYGQIIHIKKGMKI
jgi:2-C-methyl-D-erythritol 4-phosphate cytidylyltransferase